MGKINNLKISLVAVIAFFIAGLFTLTSYGINWDTINHLPRGQAYLHYFLTGKKDYSDLPKFFYDWNDKNQWYWQNPKSLAIDTDIPLNQVPERSMYQTGVADFNYFMSTDGDGHPPLSDILSSVFNRILFGKLRIINDIDSYRVYGVLLASLLVGLVFFWASKLYGKVAGLIAVASLALYPLFWSEMHFNTEKDIPETVYWAFMFFCIWKGVKEKSVKWILLSGIFFGLALGTKFNILFAVFALVPWIMLYFVRNRKEFKFKKTIQLIIAAGFSLVTGIVIFVGSWPYLWPDPISRVSRVINFYKGIGISSSVPDPRFIFLGLNTYPIQWIMYSTPVVVLLFFVFGVMIIIFRSRKEKELSSLLFLLWFLVPIARVSWSSANTYGGVRQIMEYIPAVALIAGIGGSYIFKSLKTTGRKLKIFLLVCVLFFVSLPVLQTHPNENVYFNQIIGGLSGAKKANLPYWGFSFGAAYRQGIEWINEHAEANANLVYAYELIPNIPRLWIRPDIVLSNSNRSGYLAKGEYAITLTYQGTDVRSYYDSYLEKFLKPTFQVKVDDTAILKVWKNDKEHLMYNFTEKVANKVQLAKNNGGLYLDLARSYKVSRLEMNYSQTRTCEKLAVGYVELLENEKWQRLPGVLPDDWRISLLGEQPHDGHFIEPFLGQNASMIHISLDPADTCLKNIKDFSVYYFE